MFSFLTDFLIHSDIVSSTENQAGLNHFFLIEENMI